MLAEIGRTISDFVTGIFPDWMCPVGFVICIVFNILTLIVELILLAKLSDKGKI